MALKRLSLSVLLKSFILICFVSQMYGQDKKLIISSDGTINNYSPTENRYAFLLGIDLYDDAKITSFTSCRIDAQKLATFLVSNKGGSLPDDNIKIFFNLDKEAIINNFRNFLNAIPNPKVSTLYFYYSGHGTPGSIVPSDYTEATPEKLISYDWLKQQIENRGIAIKVIFLDACYSGSMITQKTLSNFDESFKGILSENAENSTIVFTASSDTRTTASGENVSFFTKNLLEILKNPTSDPSGDGLLTSGELYDALFKKLETFNPPMFFGSRNFPMAIYKPSALPDASLLKTDTDMDGVIDTLDSCPEIAGSSSNHGCPLTEYNTISFGSYSGFRISDSKGQVVVNNSMHVDAYEGIAISSSNGFYGIYDMNKNSQVIANEFEYIKALANGHFELTKYGEKMIMNDRYKTIVRDFHEADLYYLGEYYYIITYKTSPTKTRNTGYSRQESYTIQKEYYDNKGRSISQDAFMSAWKSYGNGWNSVPNAKDIDRENEKYVNKKNEEDHWGLFNKSGKQILPYCSSEPIVVSWDGARIVIPKRGLSQQLILKVQIDGTCDDNCLDQKLYERYNLAIKNK